MQKISFHDTEIDASLLEDICGSFADCYMRCDNETQIVTFMIFDEDEVQNLLDELAKATDVELHVS